MATLLLNKGEINLVKNVVKPLYFYLYGKTDMKYEISVSELTPPPNFSFIPEFVIHFHTTKFGFNWPSNNTDKEGDGIQPPYLMDFSDPIPVRVKV